MLIAQYIIHGFRPSMYEYCVLYSIVTEYGLYGAVPFLVGSNSGSRCKSDI